MPSFGIHFLIEDELRDAFLRSSDAPERSAGKLLAEYPDHAALGAIGPDLFYYIGTGPAISAAVAKVFNFLNGLGDILKDAGQAIQDAGMPNTGDRIRQIAETAQLFVSLEESAVLGAVVEVNDFITGDFILRRTEAQAEKSEAEWKWGDILHDRVTGLYARMLTSQADQSSNEAWSAYSIAYKSHLAGDFVGHPFVNSVVGGPARGWPMRHSLAEKFMDAAAFAARGQDINTSRLYDRLTPLLNSSGFGLLASMMSNALVNVSARRFPFQLPPAPRDRDIVDAFEHMYSLFRLVTKDSYIPPPKSPQVQIPPLPGQYGTITSRLSNALPSASPRTLTDVLLALLSMFALIVAFLVDMARFIADIVVGLVTYPIAVALYLVEVALYTLYRRIRWFLVVAGIAFPCTDELGSLLGSQFTTCRPPRDERYPHVPPPINLWKERVRVLGQWFQFDGTDLPYLVYPTSAPEMPVTRASPYPTGSTPDFFINQLRLDSVFMSRWRNASTPQQLRTLVDGIAIAPGAVPTGGFGNAVELSRVLVRDDTWLDLINLDSDRGYGYRNWMCNGGIGAGLIVGERFY